MRSRQEPFATAVAIAGLLGLVILWILGDCPATPSDSRTLKGGPKSEISDFQPGRCDLVIKPPFFPPRLLGGVSLGPTHTALGTIHLELGGAVVVEMIAAEGSRAGYYVLTAGHLEGIP